KILAQYQTNVRKNIDSAIVYLQKVLNVDPEDAQAKKYIDILTKAKQQQEKAQKNTSGTSSSGKAASTSAASKRK
ncbi:MAG TPA: hypothetical protein VFS31_00920, partial [Chitinophagaceae bacterium]|nr:hypothetical protein [Chitinophagaceae bacterium]